MTYSQVVSQTLKELDEFKQWIKEDINPQRIKDRLSPISEAEQIKCFNILKKFNERFNGGTSDWIKIDDELPLPPKITDVLVWNGKHQHTGYYGGPDSGWHHNSHQLDSIFPVPTHWKYLEQPPKEGKE